MELLDAYIATKKLLENYGVYGLLKEKFEAMASCTLYNDLRRFPPELADKYRTKFTELLPLLEWEIKEPVIKNFFRHLHYELVRDPNKKKELKRQYRRVKHMRRLIKMVKN